MSAHSSSGSWSGGGGAPADIIDLDKFMRGNVRPSRPEAHMRDQLVVDAGGVERKAGGAVATAPAPLTAASSSSGSHSRPPPHAKRFSHDSGLSDGSYSRRKHRPHKRAPTTENPVNRAPRTPAGSTNSLRAFRAVCERALLDQQAQIARVAQLCERLTERAPRHRSERSVSPDTSDVSSSSRSTRDQRRKDKHRTEECKTYKIIMNKLDELNRLFAARARSPPAAATAPAPAAPLAPRAASLAPRPASLAPRPAPRTQDTPSSASVSVSDKLVATEPELRPNMQLNHNTVTCVVAQVRGGCESVCGAGGAGGCGSTRTGGGGVRAVTNTCALDIAPRDAMPGFTHRNNIATESVVQCESRVGTGSSAGDPRCGFDLDDPVHLYSQAKRLQALPATTRRARSVDPTERRYSERLERLSARSRGSGRRADGSLCALCRGYWRAITHYLAAQIFCYPDTA